MPDSQAQTENLIIRRFRYEDIPKILELFLFLSVRRRARWFLKYERSPWSTAGYVAFDKDTAVAFYGGKAEFSLEARRFGRISSAMMTHPAYRGKFSGKRPVIVRLGEMFYAETAWISHSASSETCQIAVSNAGRRGAQVYKCL